MIESDIAVIEREDGHCRWEVVAYIGPDRSGGDIDREEFEQPCRLRIRYLKQKQRCPDCEEAGYWCKCMRIKAQNKKGGRS